MDDRTISNLQTHIVNVPGGRDKEERCVIAVHVPQQCNNLDVSSTLTYIISIFSNETARRGFTVILDARKCPWRVARSCIRQVNAAFPTGELAQFIVLRPDAFWDKQRVESCRNAQKDGQVIFIPLSRLFKYVERPQLPIELGGNFIFNSNQWFENRMKVEEFYEESEKCSIDLKELQESISNIYTLKASQIQNNHQLLLERLDVLKIVANNCIDKGSKLIEKIEYDNRNRKFESESESMATPQDIADTIDKLETIVGSMRKQLINLDNLKNSMRKSFANTKDLLFLEEGVQFVVNWVLGPAEDMFKRNLKVGYDLASAEELRRAHERIELECWNAYGAYAELLFKIESFANETMLSQQQKDLISQKDFMDFVCRSFANRLERRRNILITSLRFFRLVSEYFDKTGDVFDAVVVKNEMSNFATAEVELKKLFECQRALDVVERELFKEGEKLSDMLSMPVKDALGREILANYSDDIGNIRDIMDATTARKNILSDSVELQKLTLEQTTIIHQFESDAVQAIQWLDELFHGLLKYHGHVGCTVYEIQAQKIDHQTYLETARCSYNYGMQLIQAAAALRDSCKLPQTDNKDVMQNLHFAWDKFLKISQEQMTRLRVCAVFHRSVEEQCNQMRNLREAIATISLVEAAKRCQRVKQYCAVRERLLVDVGRMVRLGRLLRSRLKEPLYSIDRMSESVSDLEKIEITEPTDNETAVEAIGERLVEITDLAEELDQTLKSAQQDAMISSTATSLPIPIGRSDKYHSQDNLGSLSPRNIRSDDGKSDEEFLTASDCTLHHSRSSSYNTASDSEHLSQWWEYGKDDMHDDIAKEKMVLAVGLPDLPLAKTVLKPSPDVPRGKIAREVTETTHIKVQHTHAFDVKSFVLTSETVRNTQDIKCGGDVSVKTEVSKVSDLRPSDEDNEQLQYLKKLQECGEWLQLKILEVTPELTALGDTLEEALQLQQAHNAVLHQIQNKQSPVDELLRQADQLISTQKPRAEVYAAMAESLGRAWNDINGHLENRKILLDLNVQYHTRAQEFFDSMSALEAACSDTLVPIEIESVKTLLNNIHELRRTVLESLMAAMQAGNMIIGNLKELEAEGTLDSRPDRIRLSAKKALTQVQEWMERLHYRRQALETIFTQRKIQLEQCLALAMLSFDLRQLQDTIAQRKDTLTASDQLGDSVSSAELLKRELEKLIAEGHMLQDKALKITKTTEHLLESGCLAGEQAKRNAYDVLSSTSDYISELQHRDALFEKVIRFFKTAQSAFSQLDLIDMQLKNNELPATSPQLAQLHERCIHAVEEITASLISEGYALLADIGTEMNASGVRNVLEELERRKIHFDGVCVAHKEENKKIARALTNFFERQDELSDWLIKVAETFLREHYDMGNSLADARDFLGLHNQLLNDLQTKGNEINTLLLTLPPILEYLDDHQRLQVEMKVEALHERWLNLKNVLEARLDWAVLYVKFHTEADKVENEMNNIDQIITDHEDLSEEAEKAIENRIGELVPLYQSAKNTGATFINEAKKVTEPPHLNIKAAFGCVESVLDRLGSRQITLQRNWQTVLTRCVEKREVEVLIKENMEESTKTINWMSKMDTQLYPIITTNETDPKIVAQHIENKLNDVLTQIRNAESEIEQRMRVADTIIQRSPNDQTFLIKQKLLNMKQNLKMICTDYQTLMQMMVSYFNNIDKIDLIVTEYFESFDAGKSLEFYPNIDLLLREFENRKQSIHNQFNMAKREKETIIDKINKQEPKDVAQQDIEKLHYLLQIREEEFTKVYREAKDNIEAQKKIHVFETDLHQINVTLDELNKKLDVVKGQYGQSLSAAEDTSLSFVYFEETVKLLEPKISEFIETGANMLQNQEALQSQKIKEQINNLQQRWDALKTRIRELRNLINLSVQYFTLIDNANKWFQEGNILLSSIATRSTMVKQPEDAQVLLNEIELFLKPGESKQSQRIEEIIELATRLFGDELSHEIPHESQIMMESYNLITQELNGLWTKIKNIETAKAAVVEPEQSVVIEEIHEVPDVVESPTLEVPVFTSPLNDQLIEEGSTFTFVCRVTGNPVPVVTWHKDGISIQNNPDYQTLFDQGLCSLTIDETFNEDSARYTCRAINAAGAAETEAYLTVKENLPEEQLIPPHFIKELQPGLINENESFEFVCKLEGNPLPTVQWYKNLNCIDNSSYYSITYNNGEARLLISKVHLDDKADYTCKAYNEVGIAQSTANLNVTSLEPTRMPAFITPLSNIMARAGQKIKLECEVTGLPTPKLNWSKDGKPLTETHELKLHFDGSKATLIIHEAFPKDAGTYTASASNLVGEVSSVSTITVKGRLPPETSDSELASDMEPIKPSIQVPLKDVSINEGNRVRLDCVIVGQPEPEVIWYHDDRPVQESSDFQLLFQGDRCSLVIKEALLEDAGEYKVVALNSAGEASSKAALIVTPNADKVKASDDKFEAVGSAPKFSKLLSDILVSENDTVILEATVSGDPKPEIKWLLNNAAIEADAHINISQDENGNLKLLIEHVKPEDRGVYTVKASNHAGEAKCFAQLIVKTLRSHETSKVHEEAKIKPSFRESFKDKAVVEGTAIKFECIVTGKPTPKIRWLFNDTPVAGKDFLISTSGNREVLSINEVTKDHIGKITCVAENEAGQETCSANLEIQPSQDIALPQDLIVSNLISGQGVTMKREVNIQSSSSTTSHIFSSTTGMAPHVEEHKYSSQDAKYFKQINQNAPEVKESSRQEEYHKIGDQPPVVHEKVTSVDIVSAIESSVPKSIFKARPPKFVTPVIGKIVDQDANVVLEGILDASPTPEVTWTKNGNELQSGNNVTVTFKHNSARVELKDVAISDAGRYTCTAVNEAGKAISTADLVVRKTIFPPVFGRRLQAQVISKGQRAIMEVEISGTPDPEITWFKDGQPIKTDAGSDYKLIAQGNCQRLILEKAEAKHTGKYMVCAVNPGGEAQSIADIAVFDPTPDTMVEVVKTVVYEDVRKHETMKLVSTPIVSVSTSAPLEPFPFKPDPPVQRVKVPPPPSPSKFVKGEFRESDYESDYDGRLSTSWHLGQEKHFKPVRPVLTPTLKPQRTERLPTPPNEFENPSKVEMPTKPKFEPIEKHKKSVKLEEIIKPIPKPTPTSKFIIRPPVTDIVPATPRVQEKIIILQPGTPPELVYTPGPKTTQYYRSTTSAPYHNAVQTETSNIMNFNESTENSHRTVSLQQTTKVIKFGESSKKSVTPVPSKFIPGDYRESDYESEVDSVKIQSKWTPTGKSGDSYYRRVKAPTFVRASSVPSSRDHVKTPMEYDTQPPFIPQATADKTVQISNMRGISQNITKQTASKIASEHMSNMTQTFKSKAHKFASDIMDDVNKTKVQKPILRSKDDSDAQVYREESRAAQYGTKHVDPNTGLIYFKYDFGYEFGIVLPGDGKPGEIPMPKKTIIQPPQRSESIEMPVYHETSKPEAVTPQFQPKKFKAPNKNVKWEPTSESEMSECETDRVKKQTWEQSSCSPISISPSLPSTSPAFNNYQGGLKDCEQQTNGNVNSQLPTKRAPVFITPLRDIAAVCGQIARFECIVQSDPPPTILWSKNSRLIENSQDYQVYFRNGVCRLTIPKTYPEDAGTYTCTATNQTGAVSTTATLQVPGERRSSYI
ncbi:titin-like isoform X4 [Atheta coriaria]|uniref:titin-like isoform X4 n=1 Tax=Dalotia coriaria TaxID=877792 RepID=UPI0031F36000